MAHVRDGWAVQQNIVRAEGKRSVLLTIIKNGDASTLDVVNRVKAALPGHPEGGAARHEDQRCCSTSRSSCRSAIDSVLREGAIAAGLTALMILLFLGSLALDPRRHGVDPAVDPDLDRGARRRSARPSTP